MASKAHDRTSDGQMSVSHKRPIPIEREVSLERNDVIGATTDPRGRITYANRIFMRIADYREDELLGQPQSIIRHLDMPRGVFKLLWDVIRAGDECVAYVKNLCKNGSYYWVFVQ